jgi:hypothetical protein
MPPLTSADQAHYSWQRATPEDVLTECKRARSDHPFLKSLKAVRPWGREFEGTHIGRVHCPGAFVESVLGPDGLCTNLFVVRYDERANRFETFFLPGCPLVGCFTPLGLEPDGEIVVVADYASGIAIHRATGEFVVVAHYDANLLAAGRSATALYPGARITFAAGRRREQDRPEIARLLIEAAESLSARVAIPKGSLQSYQTFADLSTCEGETAVSVAIDAPGALECLRGNFATPEGPPVVWPSRIHAGALIDQLVAYLRRYTYAKETEYTAIALWTVCTHFAAEFDTAPILALLSLTRRSGKSRTLRIIEHLARSPDKMIDVTLAALYEACSDARTLLIDEADQFLDNRDLLQVLNGGHMRSGGKVRRYGGKSFDVYGFKVVSAIGELPTTLMDRAICIHLVRKSTDTHLAMFDASAAAEAAALRSMIEALQHDQRREVRQAAPIVPDLGNDRAADNWTPLLKVCEAAGTEWTAAALDAARTLTSSDNGLPTSVEEFILDLVKVFQHDQRDFIPTEELIRALTSDEERPWATFVRGKPIQNRDLANLMRQARVPVGEQHNDGIQNRRGYYRRHIQPLIDGYGSPRR